MAFDVSSLDFSAGFGNNNSPAVVKKTPNTGPKGGFRGVIDRILSEGGNMAGRIEKEEQRRYSDSLDVLKRGAGRFAAPTLTDQDIQRMFSGAADSAGRDYRANMGNLRSELGMSGQTGNSGQAQAAARRYKAMRAAALTDAQRSLYEKRIETDTMDRQARWAADQVVASGIARDPSMIGMDWLGASGTLAMTGYAADQQAKAARENADAQRDAGLMSGIGGALSGLISAL